MIYLHSGGGDLTKQNRVNKVATEKASEIAENKTKLVSNIESELSFFIDAEKIGAILLIEPSIKLALEICRQYVQSIDIVIAESAKVGSKLTACQIEFQVIKICVL